MAVSFARTKHKLCGSFHPTHMRLALIRAASRYSVKAPAEVSPRLPLMKIYGKAPLPPADNPKRHRMPGADDR